MGKGGKKGPHIGYRESLRQKRGQKNSLKGKYEKGSRKRKEKERRWGKRGREVENSPQKKKLGVGWEKNQCPLVAIV